MIKIFTKYPGISIIRGTLFIVQTEDTAYNTDKETTRRSSHVLFQRKL